MLQDLARQASWNKKIALLQVLHGLTQEQAANRCGTNQKAYWNWINGKTYPRKNSRKAIARAFNISEEEIFGSGVIWATRAQGHEK